MRSQYWRVCFNFSTNISLHDIYCIIHARYLLKCEAFTEKQGVLWNFVAYKKKLKAMRYRLSNMYWGIDSDMWGVGEMEA